MQQLVATDDEKMLKTFPASLEKLYEMLQFVKDAAHASGFDDDQVSKIELALEEALVNIISYGFPNRLGNLEIECINNRAGEMEITLIDHGVPYNPLSTPIVANPYAPVEAQTEGGYGILLIKKLMDQVKYRRENGRNVLTLIRKINQG
jgi:anti-sigma regulatory factor (Ser/Thr protein kinase)